MALDNAKNHARVTVAGGYTAGSTSVVLQAGHGTKLPTAPFNMTWWCSSLYASPSDDPNVEEVRCTAVVSDTLTLTRAQEGSAASIKNLSGKTYKMIAGLTAKTINIDFPATYLSLANAANLYQPAGTYLTPTGAATVSNKTGNISQWTNDSGYTTAAVVAALYQPIGAYLTSVTAHNLLSATHGDTLTDTVIRGDLLYANATPKWARLSKPSVLSGLSHDGTDVSWVTANGTGAPARTTNVVLVTPTLGVASFKSLTGSGDTVTATTPLLDLSQTWNNAAVAFTGLRANITNTASAAASLLIDLQASGSTVAAISRAGNYTGQVLSGYASLELYSTAATALARTVTDRRVLIGDGATGSGVFLGSTHRLAWSSNAPGSGDAANANDLTLFRDAANTLALRNSTAAQTFNLYNSWTDASNLERLAFKWSSNIATIQTEALGTGTARALRLLMGDGNIAMVVPTGVTGGSVILSAFTIGSANITRVGIASGSSVTATSGTHVDFSAAGGAAPSATSTMAYRGVLIAPTINYSNATPGAGSYEALKIAVTETALPTGSNYLIRASAGVAGATDKFTVTNAGVVTSADHLFNTDNTYDIGASGATRPRTGYFGTSVVMPGGSSGSPSIRFPGTSTGIWSQGDGYVNISQGACFGSDYSFYSAGKINIGSANGSAGVFVINDANNIWAQRNSTSAQTWRLYEAYTDASNYSRLSISAPSGGPITFASEAAGTGAVRPFSFTGSNATFAGITCSGLTSSSGITLTGTTTINAGGAGLYFNYNNGNGTVVYCDGTTAEIFRFVGSSKLFQFGGTTSSYPALKRSAAILQGRLADDSAFCEIQAKFKSSDGSAGVTAGPYTTITSITVKDGLITAISGS